MPEASEAQKRVMDKLGIRHDKATSMRDASMRIQRYHAAEGYYEPKPRISFRTEAICTDCDEPLTPTEKLSLMPDGTTAGTYPKRPVCHRCESGYRLTKEKEGY